MFLSVLGIAGKAVAGHSAFTYAHVAACIDSFDSVLASCFVLILVAAWNDYPLMAGFKITTYVLVLFELLFRGKLNRYLTRVDESGTKLIRYMIRLFCHRIRTLPSAIKPALKYAGEHIKDPVVIDEIETPFQFSRRHVHTLYNLTAVQKCASRAKIACYQGV